MEPRVLDRKAKNIEIFKETTSIIKYGSYTAPSGKIIPIDTDTMVQGSECFHQQLPSVIFPPVQGGTIVMVEMNDCLVAAERLVKEGYNPALLNFASAKHPGGGVEKGTRAQEETICRRSTLSRSIYTFDEYYSVQFGYPLKPGNNYPLKSLDFSVIYSPAVTVFREGLECTFMEHPFQIGIITNAALNLNGRNSIKLTRDGNLPENAKNIYRNKIRTIFRIGLLKGHDSLVLGAFGCGAFHNPPLEMAHLFKEIMEEEEFKNRYKLITFAIITDHNDQNQNLKCFKEVFN